MTMRIKCVGVVLAAQSICFSPAARADEDVFSGDWTFHLRSGESCESLGSSFTSWLAATFGAEVLDSEVRGTRDSSCLVEVRYIASASLGRLHANFPNLIGRGPENRDVSAEHAARFPTPEACEAAARVLERQLQTAGQRVFRIDCFADSWRMFEFSVVGRTSGRPVGWMLAVEPEPPNFVAFSESYLGRRLELAESLLAANGILPAFSVKKGYYAAIFFAMNGDTPPTPAMPLDHRLRIFDHFTTVPDCEAAKAEGRSIVRGLGGDPEAVVLECVGWEPVSSIERASLQAYGTMPSRALKVNQWDERFLSAEACEEARPGVVATYRDRLGRAVIGSMCVRFWQEGPNAHSVWNVLLFERSPN